MSVLNEQWLQDIAEAQGLPALNPTIVKMMLPVIEVHIKKIVQQANKFQRRGKASAVSVEDVNSALSLNKIEPVYGLSRPEHIQALSGSTDLTQATPIPSNVPTSSSAKQAQTKKLVNLVEYGKSTAPIACPLKPEVGLHWLAVNGSQPLTAENPSVVIAEAEEQPLSLPKELQQLYARIVGIVLSANPTTPTVGLSAVMKVLRTDTGIQELTPYLSRCFYQQIRANTRRLVLLRTIIGAIKSLLRNPSVDLEFHLQQLLPAVFTCVVGARLSSSPSEDHWSLRSASAEVIAELGAKFSGQFPELHARICKTYLDALEGDKCLPTLYGAIVGLSAMGNHAVRTLLLPHLSAILGRLQEGEQGNTSGNRRGSTIGGNGANSVASGSNGHVNGAGVSAQDTQTQGKRKRSDSIDNNHIATSATGANDTNGSTTGSSSSSSRVVTKFNKHTASKVLQEQVTRGMCREALIKALGKYIAYSVKLPDLGQKHKRGNSGLVLGDLEEALVPYYASASKQKWIARIIAGCAQFDSMEDIKEWVESVKSTLLFGFEGDARDAAAVKNDPPQLDMAGLSKIKEAADEYLKSTSSDAEKDYELLEKLDSFATDFEKKNTRLDTARLMQKIENYIKLRLKIQHMSLMRAMHQLRRYKSVKDIPGLIFAVRDDVPGVLLPHSRIKKVVMDTVNEIKQKLLAQFHQLLENHLVASQNDSISDDNIDRRSAARNAQWTAFLSQARDWLLAYTMVSLLPTVLTETQAMILEKFQSTLDEALTPTWGRYHFHLQVARKARSSQQIIWTFEYTRSFVSMMCDLSQALTSSGELQKLCDLDYASAGQKQVLEKAAKFMRAHLAQIVVDFSPLSRELCMQLVEETFELDDWLHGIARTTIAEARGAESTVAGSVRTTAPSSHDTRDIYAPITVCAVIYDAKEMFHQWLLLEHRHFHFELRGKFQDGKKVFQFAFGNEEIASPDANSPARSVNPAMKGLSFQATRQRCYQGVYQCMALFFTASERYQYLPPAAQRILSIVVLEPLLCTALGLLLYKTRNSSVLYQISMGTYKPVSSPGRGPKHIYSSSFRSKNTPFGANETPNATPDELQEYYDSAQYFQACLEHSARRHLVSHSASQFRASLWSELQSWMPQMLISEVEVKNGFSAVDLVDKAWKLSEEYTHEHNFEYRNISNTSPTPGGKGSFLRGAGGLSDVGSGKGNANKGGGSKEEEVCEIGACVDVARGLALTLCDVLQKQLAICR